VVVEKMVLELVPRRDVITYCIILR
jgi:hypothetical protein